VAGRSAPIMLGVCAAPGAPYRPDLAGPPLPPCEADRIAFMEELKVLVSAALHRGRVCMRCMSGGAACGGVGFAC